MSLPQGDTRNPILASKLALVAGGAPVLSLVKAVILWRMLSNASLWGRKEIGLFSHESLQMMGLAVSLSRKLQSEASSRKAAFPLFPLCLQQGRAGTGGLRGGHGGPRT